MRAHLPWLGQGDIFSEVPVLGLDLGRAASIRAETTRGPAVLISHDCAMDKPDKATGLPLVERLQFARLRSMSALGPDKQASLKGARYKVGPFEALYVGELPQYGETFLLLSDLYPIPAPYFGLELRAHAGHPNADSADAKYTSPTENDSRIGRLDEDQLDLLREKMVAFWTRLRIDK